MDALRGRRWFAEVFQRDDYDHAGKYRHAYVELARKPEAERSSVAATITAALERGAGKRRALHPQHVLDHWAVYLAGELPWAPRREPAAPQGPRPAYHDPIKFD